MRRALPCAVAVVTALAVQALAGRLLAGRDVVLALLGGSQGPTPALIAALVGARLFLFLLAPGWALHVAMKALVERYRQRSARSQSGRRR